MIQWPGTQDMTSPLSWLFEGEPAGLGDTGSVEGAGQGTFGLDDISRFMQFAQESASAASSNPLSFISPGFGMLQAAGSAIGQWFSGTPQYNGEQYYASASGGSNGDPHISFNGSTWNDMQSEPDLLHSDSIPGGYQLSTQTTAPNANGVTYNQSATVTTHGGRTQVSLTNSGVATIAQNGVATNLSPGQTVQLGNESVTCNANGSLQITSHNQDGGQITTTMTQNGNGVDVNVSANNVDLGGAMVNGNGSNAPAQSLPPQRPVMRRYDAALSPSV
ncbi:MAG TPA: hypothetical protein VMA98_05225 [Candidatus Acidoferrales bacterium]|nr:hypothetical protein [Candidatus Acidoferrales bacterium]